VLVLLGERGRVHGVTRGLIGSAGRRVGRDAGPESFRHGKRRIAHLLLEHAPRVPSVSGMYFRQLLYDDTACASYLLGCKTHSRFAVVDPHADLVDEYVALAAGQGIPIAAVFETHVQADHVSGLPELVRRTGATAYLPAGAGVDFAHEALADGEVVKLGNTELRAVATPGHALAHHAYLVTDRTRGDEPWFVLTGDALLVGDAGRPDLHAGGDHSAEDMARTLYRSLTERLLTLPDHLALYPAHYSGSVCGRGLSSNPVSTIGFERRHNRALKFDSEDAFVAALLEDIPPAPDNQAGIVAANRAGRPLTTTT
jgi:hydroxyacylglutathione hydrolase